MRPEIGSITSESATNKLQSFLSLIEEKRRPLKPPVGSIMHIVVAAVLLSGLCLFDSTVVGHNLFSVVPRCIPDV